MKKLILLGIIGVFTGFLTSCESDTNDSGIIQTEVNSRAALAIDLPANKLDSNLPQTIQELKVKGISVSRGLADYVRNLENLLWAANKSISQGRMLVRRYGFYRSEVRELRLIKRGYDALVASANRDTENESSDNTGGDTVTKLPTTIAEARAAGIQISANLEELALRQNDNDAQKAFTYLLTRSLVSTGFLDMMLFSSRHFSEMREIREQYKALQA